MSRGNKKLPQQLVSIEFIFTGPLLSSVKGNRKGINSLQCCKRNLVN